MTKAEGLIRALEALGLDRGELKKLSLTRLQALYTSMMSAPEGETSTGMKEGGEDSSEGEGLESKQGEGENVSSVTGKLPRTRGTLADLKGMNAPKQRQKVSSQRIKDVVNEAIRDSKDLLGAIKDALSENQEETRDSLGIDRDLKELAESVAKDLEEELENHEREIRDALEDIRQRHTTRIEIQVPEMPTITAEDQHRMFPALVANYHLRHHTLMVGPSGSGKTTAGEKLAELTGKGFSYVALGPGSTESVFAGYSNAVGEYVPTQFYFSYRYGQSLMMVDELDASDPGPTTWLNGAVQNGVASFPVGWMSQYEYEAYYQPSMNGSCPPFERHTIPAGGMVTAHPDFFLMASANTYGQGADLRYHGRNPIDAATMKRFAFLRWPYDLSLESKLANDSDWVHFVWSVREYVDAQEYPYAITPVDSIRGARMLKAGLPLLSVMEQTVLGGMPDHLVKEILGVPVIQSAMNALVKREENHEAAA